MVAADVLLMTLTLGGVLIVAGLAILLGALVVDLVRRKRGGEVPNSRACAICGAGLMPLLDGAHRFVGEVVCARGHMLRGVTWPSS